MYSPAVDDFVAFSAPGWQVLWYKMYSVLVTNALSGFHIFHFWKK